MKTVYENHIGTNTLIGVLKLLESEENISKVAKGDSDEKENVAMFDLKKIENPTSMIIAGTCCYALNVIIEGDDSEIAAVDQPRFDGLAVKILEKLQEQ